MGKYYLKLGIFSVIKNKGIYMKKLSCLLIISMSLCLLGASHSANATNYFNWGVETDMTSKGYNVEYLGLK